MELGPRITLPAFVAALQETELQISADVRTRLQQARDVVEAAAEGQAPVYGLNTGLGANLGHRIAPEDIAAFQRQLIDGRAVAVGAPLPPETGRAVLLARLIGASRGHSGMSLPMFDHLCAVYRAGLSPAVPGFGSIGASDLTQNAVWARALLGEGEIWNGSDWQDAGAALAGNAIVAPPVAPKDAMALINHGATSAALAAHALWETDQALYMAQHAAALSFEGFGGNRDILAASINTLRPAPGQAQMAAWFAERIVADEAPRRVQDALSFRTLAPVLGAARDAVTRAIAVIEDELNGASDSPAVIGDHAMRSTPNFQAPALALALEQVSLAVAMVGQGAVMRIQRLMNPELTGLPRYLSPVGGASAGFVPLQKTAAALLADIRRHAMPVSFDPAPVSDGVEDMAPMTAQAALKLADQSAPLGLLAAAEALVAAQARDLRALSPSPLHQAIRAEVPLLTEDRALGPEVERTRTVLRRYVDEIGDQ